MTQLREIAQWNRRRNGKRYRISMMIDEIKQLLSREGNPVELNYLWSSLVQTLTQAAEQHDVLMSFLHTDHPDYNDTWIDELISDVDSLSAKVSSYIALDTLSISSKLPAETRTNENPPDKLSSPIATNPETTGEFEVETLSKYEQDFTVTSEQPQIYCDVEIEKLEPSDICASENIVLENTHQLNVEILQSENQTTMTSITGIRYQKHKTIHQNSRYDSYSTNFPPTISKWFDKLKRDSEVSRQLAGKLKLSGTYQSTCIGCQHVRVCYVLEHSYLVDFNSPNLSNRRSLCWEFDNNNGRG